MSFTGSGGKILPADEVVARFGRPRDEQLVFTNGCFDILHRGHVELLEDARSQGDRLVVAINSDASVRRLKGAGRPVNPREDRAHLLAALAAVDVVTWFADDTPAALIERLLPDVLVKGGDYLPREVVGADAVRAAGGRVVLAPLVPGRSTTAILQRASGRHA